MNQEFDFIEQIVQEAEMKEEQQTEAYYDLLLLSIRKLNQQIEYNFQEAEKECSMINNFVLNKNTQLQEKICLLELKLEAFIRERGEKTITLPNGTLKMHKRPDKVEIDNMDLFLKNAKPELLTVIPESVKPDINMIKAYIKIKPLPPGVKVTTGQEQFSYKLNIGETYNAREKETGTGTQQTDNLRAVV